MRIHQLRRVLRSRPEVFAYTADVANAEEWDPIVGWAQQVDSDAVGLGAKYELVLRFGRASIPILYQITGYEPDYRLVLNGRNTRFEVVNDIKFLEDGEATVIDYTANVRLMGYLRLAGPAIAPFIKKAVSRSVDALVAGIEG